MNKSKIIATVSESAKLYKQNLCNKNVLFITDKYEVIKVSFLHGNFLHFTGLKTKLNPNQFFNACVNNKLKERDISDDLSNFVRNKLNVLSAAMFIHKNARMIGDYDGFGLYLKTDKLVGDTTLAVGIKETVNNNFIPNSLIETDVRNRTVSPISSILLIAVKNFSDKKYSITYLHDSFSFDKLPKEEDLSFHFD